MPLPGGRSIQPDSSLSECKAAAALTGRLRHAKRNLGPANPKSRLQRFELKGILEAFELFRGKNNCFKLRARDSQLEWPGPLRHFNEFDKNVCTFL